MDITDFLQLNAGDWLALRSTLSPELGASVVEAPHLQDGTGADRTQPWHDSDRAELHIALLAPISDIDWGGLEMKFPDQSAVRLIFHRVGTVAVDSLHGRWHLGDDGSLELTIEETTRTLKERIWFRKPNLRLRSTLEILADGRPGRASFSSEIRRVRHAA